MAHYGEQITLPGVVAGADLSAWQYKPVKFASTAGQVIKATATTDAIIGILQNDPASGEAADVAIAGVSKAITGTSVLAIGAAWTANSTGVLATTSDNTRIGGFNLGSAAAAVGDVVVVRIQPARY